MNENNKIFGTDGIRGRVGEHPMTVDFTMRLASAIASTLTPNGGQVAIGKDTRISGYMFESALESAFVAYGLKVILLGPLPSPAISHYVRESDTNFGVVISASHNSYEYNGIKIINQNGEKIASSLENIIESKLSENPITKTANMIGKAYRSADSRDKYKELLFKVFNEDTQPLKGLKIVVDASNGAAYKIAPQILLELGAEVIPIACSPNGYNINKNCGSTFPETIKNTVKATNSDLGIALDGDADRILIIDEQGEILDGDQILFILTIANIDNPSFNSKVVGTVMTNSGLDKSLNKKNIELLRSDVGDKNVYKMMQSTGSIIGGETSGHIINLEYLPTGDGLLTALIIIKESLNKKLVISELIRELTLVKQQNINLDIQNIETKNIEAFQAKASKLIDDGRVIIRKSGTEPLIRILIESENEDIIKQVNDLIKEISK
ncbi:MAG TPA: phosphoglucosamine mutase [Gammaproteobacteria bacterium]|jgi:phosphoglucosamine mutase|nr:phosphoglucosamine mutase [Gammaproteobacteria bacterium]HIK76915.1 phosphoglucosamine mutase [Gammaproteobacteria bacterium]